MTPDPLDDAFRGFESVLRAKGVDPAATRAAFDAARPDREARAIRYLSRLAGNLLTLLVRKGVLTREEALAAVSDAREAAP